MIIDTHSHLSFKAYDDDRDEVIKRAQKQGVVCVDVGTKYETSQKAVELAEKNENIFASIGLHPIHIKTDLLKLKVDEEEGAFQPFGEEFNKEKYKKLAQSKKVMAIGEIGLDYYYRPKSKTKQAEFKEKQKQVFLQQSDLARELDLPVILHCRMAHDDLIKILGAQIVPPQRDPEEGGTVSYTEIKGVIHCFTGSIEEMEQYLNLGFYIGINGIIFKMDLDEVIKKCPLDKILVETDCPYLIPPLARQSPEGEGDRNEPIFIRHIIQKIVDLKGFTFDQVTQKTTESAKKLFKI